MKPINAVPLYADVAPPTGALEVAIICKVINLHDAACLIEQYARTVAAEARLQATIDTSDRIIDQINQRGVNDARAS